jgi:ABC-type multidrug transport system ATPase subunit
MPNLIVETRQLTHRFANDEIAVNDVNLHVSEGSIYGFLGPNGAGKTTTLKLILGLLRKQSGQILLFGKPLETNREESLKRIGSLIESPSLYGHLTATENLRVWQKVYGSPASRIDEVLKWVGLPNVGRKKASQFSLGMKQRLAIAVALLHSPSLLILDEPTNGLDPNGIIEMREMLRSLSQQQGITILISSHLLAEIEKLVTDVAVINKGKLMFQGALPKLMEMQQSASIQLETNHPERTITVLANLGLSAERKNGFVVLPHLPKEKLAEINRMLVHESIDVYRIAPTQNDLESIFMDMVASPPTPLPKGEG